MSNPLIAPQLKPNPYGLAWPTAQGQGILSGRSGVPYYETPESKAIDAARTSVLLGGAGLSDAPRRSYHGVFDRSRANAALGFGPDGRLPGTGGGGVNRPAPNPFWRPGTGTTGTGTTPGGTGGGGGVNWYPSGGTTTPVLVTEGAIDNPESPEDIPDVPRDDYIQPINEDPFAGFVGGGGSGPIIPEGTTGGTGTGTGWLAPIFPTEQPTADFADRDEFLEYMAENVDPENVDQGWWEDFKQWYGDLSDGGFVKDTFAGITHAAKKVLFDNFLASKLGEVGAVTGADATGTIEGVLGGAAVGGLVGNYLDGTYSDAVTDKISDIYGGARNDESGAIQEALNNTLSEYEQARNEDRLDEFNWDDTLEGELQNRGWLEDQIRGVLDVEKFTQDELEEIIGSSSETVDTFTGGGTLPWEEPPPEGVWKPNIMGQDPYEMFDNPNDNIIIPDGSLPPLQNPAETPTVPVVTETPVTETPVTETPVDPFDPENQVDTGEPFVDVPIGDPDPVVADPETPLFSGNEDPGMTNFDTLPEINPSIDQSVWTTQNPDGSVDRTIEYPDGTRTVDGIDSEGNYFGQSEAPNFEEPTPETPEEVGGTSVGDDWFDNSGWETSQPVSGSGSSGGDYSGSFGSGSFGSGPAITYGGSGSFSGSGLWGSFGGSPSTSIWPSSSSGAQDWLEDIDFSKDYGFGDGYGG